MAVGQAEKMFGIGSWRKGRISKADVLRAHNDKGVRIQGVVPALLERTVEAPSVVEHSLAHVEAAVKLIRMQVQDQENVGKAGYKPLVGELGQAVNLKLFTGQTPAVFAQLAKGIPNQAAHVRHDNFNFLTDLTKRDLLPFPYKGDLSLPINIFALLHVCDPNESKKYSHGVYTSTDDYALFDAALRVLLKPEGRLPWDLKSVEELWMWTEHIRKNGQFMMDVHLIPMMDEESDIKMVAIDMFRSINPFPGIYYDGDLSFLKESITEIILRAPDKNWSVSPDVITKIVPGCSVEDARNAVDQLVRENYNIVKDGFGRYHIK